MRVTQLSFSFFARYFSPESIIFASKGVNVIATINETPSDTTNEIPSGFNISPSIPERKNNGKKATIIINVAFKIDALISFDASKTTVKEFCCCSIGNNLFCRRRL